MDEPRRGRGGLTAPEPAQGPIRRLAVPGPIRRLAVPDERRLAPVTACFFLFGIFWGTWAVGAVNVERALHLSNGGFGLLLSGALLGAAAGNALGGSAAERWGTGRVIGGAFAAWGILIVLGAVEHSPPLLGLLIVGVIGVGGLADVSMNVAATASLSGRPGHLVRFHARFNTGAAVGAAGTGALLASHHGWRPMWVGIGVTALGVAVFCALSSLPAGSRGEAVPLRRVFGVLRREALVLLAAAFAVGAMVEGGLELWGVLYLRTRLDSGLLIGAGGAVLSYLVAAAARVFLGPRAARRGPARGVLLGAGTAAVGALLLAGAPVAALAAAGLVLGAGGISMSWPLLLAESAAGRRRPGPVVGAVSSVGYLGLMLGPSVVGLVADRLGLRWGLVLLAAAAVFVAAAPTVRSRRLTGRPGSGRTGGRSQEEPRSARPTA